MTQRVRRVLVLGGTGWLGRTIVDELLAEGADVTCLARGTTGSVPEGARFVEADRALAGAYAQATGDWDEVIELASAPELVAPALDALADRAAHWTLVSTVSVYADNDEPGADESARLVEPTRTRPPTPTRRSSPNAPPGSGSGRGCSSRDRG